MACSTSSALLLPLLVLVLLAAAAAVSARAEASDLSPSMARRAGPVPPPPPPSIIFPEDCLPIPKDVIDACRNPPGVRGCAALCVVYHYRDGQCDTLSNGNPGDCHCVGCLAPSRHVGH